ncbi:pyridoxamine 5'-phosphate oxidase family protein [Alkalihalobacillus sp. AL-G]|uniref:pyridoxamine 5'-phosphate oxidase family protein n=1 Tax=Alkalihalobacillus sp. AL-G TaxID=2926399 RepID=UPI002729B5C5|nr:pyridoxamine 5'-phosphate oxidase family protein [Alkalihalobacillus sp. AL-G]WLD95018.1 pyridoxamine 5'-phosphate oxidase family protein [Alkalihalobacillus sp. AL-G]
MAKKSSSTLNDTLYKLLQKECFAIVSTSDPNENIPYVNAISWIYAPDMETVLLAIDRKSIAVQNLKNNENVSITLFGDETTSVISGKANVTRDPLDSVPIKLALITVKISEVRDAMFYGAKISQPPVYEKTYDAEAAAKLDRQVMDVLKAK